MINRISTAIFGATLLLSAPAMAQNAAPQGLYFAGAVGPALFFDVDLENNVNNVSSLEYGNLNFFLSGAVGYRMLDFLRGELEFLAERGEGPNANTTIYRMTAGAYAEIPVGSITPYGGGGLGFAYDNERDPLDGAQFTFHAEGGLNTPISDNLEFSPGLRYEYILTDDLFADDQSILQLRLGLRYFPYSQ